MKIPYVIDNQTHSLADILNALRAIPECVEPKEAGLLFSRLLTRVRG